MNGREYAVLKNKVFNSTGLDSQKRDVGDPVTGTDSKVPTTKKRYSPLKHGLWAQNFARGVDKRTGIGRWIIQPQAELTSHIGGHPTIVESILIERIASKVVRCRLYEAGLLAKEPMGSRDHFLAMENSLRLDCVALGLKAKQKKIVDLDSYLKQKSNQKEDLKDE